MIQAVEEAERQAREEAIAKLKLEEEQRAQEELERKAAEEASSATGQIRASLAKDDTAATVKLLNSFTVENGPAQRMSYLLEVGHLILMPASEKMLLLLLHYSDLFTRILRHMLQS